MSRLFCSLGYNKLNCILIILSIGVMPNAYGEFYGNPNHADIMEENLLLEYDADFSDKEITEQKADVFGDCDTIRPCNDETCYVAFKYDDGSSTIREGTCVPCVLTCSCSLSAE